MEVDAVRRKWHQSFVHVTTGTFQIRTCFYKQLCFDPHPYINILDNVFIANFPKKIFAQPVFRSAPTTPQQL